MITRRPHNWPDMLARFIEEKRRTRFDWAENNCAFFVCDWILRLTGEDAAADFRGRVSSALSTARLLKSHGGMGRIVDDVCAKYGWPRCPVLLARRGDVAEIDDAKPIPAIGVVVGQWVAFASESGVAFRPLYECSAAWRIV